MKKLNWDSAQEPSGISYRHLRHPKCAEVLSALYNAVLRAGVVPAGWKRAHLVLLHKRGDLADIANWRPIALHDTIYKIFAGIMADRLQRWCTAGKVQHESQRFHVLRWLRGIQYGALCMHGQGKGGRCAMLGSTTPMPLARCDMKCWRSSFRDWGFPAMLSLLTDLYDGGIGQYRDGQGQVDVGERVGLKQVCPLSPILFNIYLDVALRKVAALGIGFKCPDEVLDRAYADVALIARTEPKFQSMLDSLRGGRRVLCAFILTRSNQAG